MSVFGASAGVEEGKAEVDTFVVVVSPVVVVVGRFLSIHRVQIIKLVHQ